MRNVSCRLERPMLGHFNVYTSPDMKRHFIFRLVSTQKATNTYTCLHKPGKTFIYNQPPHRNLHRCVNGDVFPAFLHLNRIKVQRYIFNEKITILIRSSTQICAFYGYFGILHRIMILINKSAFQFWSLRHRCS